MCVESGMLKYTFSVPSPRNSNSVGLEWSPGSWIFNEDPQMISTTRYRNTILHVIHAAHLEPGCLQKHNEPEPRLISSRETPQPTNLPGHCSATAHRQNAPVSWGSSRLAINLLLIAGTPFTQDWACLPSLHRQGPAILLMAWITTGMTQTTLELQLRGLLHWVHFTWAMYVCVACSVRLLIAPTLKSPTHMSFSTPVLYSSTQCLVSSTPLALFSSTSSWDPLSCLCWSLPARRNSVVPLLHCPAVAHCRQPQPWLSRTRGLICSWHQPAVCYWCPDQPTVSYLNRALHTAERSRASPQVHSSSSWPRLYVKSPCFSWLLRTYS